MRPRLLTREVRRREGSAPVEFAWQVHMALEGWIVKADTKASVLLAFQGGAFIFATTSRSVVLTANDVRPLLVAAAGMAMLVTAMALAATAMLPALGSHREQRASYQNEWVYFGHLRLWEPAELAARLQRLNELDEVRALSAQLVRMSQLSWRKHRLVQASVVLTLLATLAMMVAMTLRAAA